MWRVDFAAGDIATAATFASRDNALEAMTLVCGVLAMTAPGTVVLTLTKVAA